MATQVALTTDIGEGLGRWSLGDDDALLEIVTSANIACGFHGGDPGIMRRTCATRWRTGRDRCPGELPRFARLRPPVHRDPGPELRDDLIYQMGALEAFARIAGGKVDFVRAHGAL